MSDGNRADKGGDEGLEGSGLSRIPDIVGVILYSSGIVEVVRREASEGKEPPNRSEYGIDRLSFRSRTRLLVTASNTEVRFDSMLTLTYGKSFPVDGRQVKRSLNRFLTWFRRRGMGEYLWFLEFQERGAPHFHLIIQSGVGTPRVRGQVAEAWIRSCGVTWKDPRPYCNLSDRKCSTIMRDMYRVHFHPRTWEKVRERDGAIRYCAKYALKTYQKEVPREYRNVGRFWGASRRVKKLECDSSFVAMNEPELRSALAVMDHRVSDWECVPKYIFGVGA